MSIKQIGTFDDDYSGNYIVCSSYIVTIIIRNFQVM